MNTLVISISSPLSQPPFFAIKLITKFWQKPFALQQRATPENPPTVPTNIHRRRREGPKRDTFLRPSAMQMDILFAFFRFHLLCFFFRSREEDDAASSTLVQLKLVNLVPGDDGVISRLYPG